MKKYAMASPYGTPGDNPYVVELLHRLGFETIENLLERSEICTRSFWVATPLPRVGCEKIRPI